MCWFLDGNPPVEVVARGKRGIVFKPAGHDVDDMTWAIVTFAGGAVINLETTIAIQRAAATGTPIRLPLET